jgi:diacylglycerol kinase
MTEQSFFSSRIKSIRIALEGIQYVLQTQKNVRIHAFITLAVFVMAFLLRINRLEWICLLLVIGLVWFAEIFNTAIEVLVDLVSPEQSNNAKVIKDISAGAVLLSAFISVLVGLLVFGPKLWILLGSFFG